MPTRHALQWTEHEIALLRELYPIMSTRAVAERLRRPHQATKQKAAQLALKKTDDYMRMHAPRFRPGHKLPLERLSNPPPPIGTEKIRHHCLMRKISETGDRATDWQYVHRIVWEEAHGPIPRGHCVTFKNGNKADIRLENLALVTAAENSRNAGGVYGAYPKELRQALYALGRLKSKISEKS